MWPRAGAGGLLLALLTALVVLVAAPAGAFGQARGGGIDGGLPDTTSGAAPVAPPVDTVPAPAATTPTTTATTAPAATTATTAPASTVPAPAPSAGVTAQAPGPDTTVAAVAPVTTAPVAGTITPGPDQVAVAAGDEGAGGIGPATVSRSTSGVRSPAVLLVGVGVALAGAAVLAVRTRRPAGGRYS